MVSNAGTTGLKKGLNRLMVKRMILNPKITIDFIAFIFDYLILAVESKSGCHFNVKVAPDRDHHQDDAFMGKSVLDGELGLVMQKPLESGSFWEQELANEKDTLRKLVQYCFCLILDLIRHIGAKGIPYFGMVAIMLCQFPVLLKFALQVHLKVMQFGIASEISGVYDPHSQEHNVFIFPEIMVHLHKCTNTKTVEATYANHRGFVVGGINIRKHRIIGIVVVYLLDLMKHFCIQSFHQFVGIIVMSFDHGNSQDQGGCYDQCHPAALHEFRGDD